MHACSYRNGYKIMFVSLHAKSYCPLSLTQSPEENVSIASVSKPQIVYICTFDMYHTNIFKDTWSMS